MWQSLWQNLSKIIGRIILKFCGGKKPLGDTWHNFQKITFKNGIITGAKTPAIWWIVIIHWLHFIVKEWYYIMYLQVLFALKAFTTVATFKRPFIGMTTDHMSLQATFGCQYFVAYVTDITICTLIMHYFVSPVWTRFKRKNIHLV